MECRGQLGSVPNLRCVPLLRPIYATPEAGLQAVRDAVRVLQDKLLRHLLAFPPDERDLGSPIPDDRRGPGLVDDARAC